MRKIWGKREEIRGEGALRTNERETGGSLSCLCEEEIGGKLCRGRKRETDDRRRQF